jgi:multidrug efflux pump
MRFTDIFIRRPVFAITLSLIVLLIGILSFTKLTIRQFPQIEASVISIHTAYSGATADLMEGFVTTPIENAIAGVDGIDYVTSSSTQGLSTITVNLKLGFDVNQATNDISNQISSIRWKLPEEIDDPVISQQDPNARPILYIAFSSQRMTLEEITDYLLRTLQPQMQTQPGVGQAVIFGDFEYAMRIWLDPAKMVAHQVTATDVQAALQQNNVQSAAGQIEGDLQLFDIYANTDLTEASQFNQLFIRNVNGRIVRIQDIGEAKLGSKDPVVSVNANGEKTIMMGIIPKTTANPLDVAKNITTLLDQIRTHMPQDLQATLVWDTSKFISSSLEEVNHTIFEAALFVFIVIFLMIGSLRAVFVPIITIPLSLIGTFGIMLALGYSINTLTLLAFVLAIGLVVDDAIVVLENVDRHLHEGMKATQAALKGAAEIAFPVIVMTLTLAAVYAPIGFATGLIGQFFTEFAFTLAGSVIVSGFIALTLSPMMCSKIYQGRESKTSKLAEFAAHAFTNLKTIYRTILIKVLHRRRFMILIAICVYISCYLLFIMIPQELTPAEDQGGLMGIMTGPAAANLRYTEEHSKAIEKIYQSIPEMEAYGIINGHPQGVNSSMSFLVLKPWDKRKHTAMEIQMNLFPLFQSIPGVQAFPVNPSSLPGASGFTPIEFILKTTGSYEELQQLADQFTQEASKIKGLLQIDNDLKIDKPQVVVNINRNKATDLGIHMNELANSFNLFLGQRTLTRFNMGGRSYDVLPELYARYRKTPTAINNLYVRTAHNDLVPLSNIATIKEQIVPESLNHFQQGRATTITASLASNLTLGDALKQLKQVADKVLPKTIEIDLGGESRQFMDTAGTMTQTFIFSLLFIYLILAAQFESFRDPLIVILSVPLSLAGALLFLILFGGTLNIYSEIGLVTLVGLITKHGILMVEFANQQREQGIHFFDAIITSATTRLRPILMTTSAMVLGALPLALASGAGAMSRRQIGLVIIGGMTLGTLFTLFVVPTAYCLLVSKKRKPVDSG